jgi:RimJ/RimL family protein N-acetyltransferase|tara:strand:- start:555 stop:974 length:420 start_codon:yes stop_codon:yes gene_type:complete
MIVTGSQREVAAWINHRIRDTSPGDYDTCTTLAVARHDKLICGVAYWKQRGGICDVAIAADSPMWATKQTIFTLLAYPFQQLEAHRLQSFIHPKNKRSRKLCAGLGFTCEGKLRRLHKDKDMLIYSYLKDEFIRSKWHG